MKPPFLASDSTQTHKNTSVPLYKQNMTITIKDSAIVRPAQHTPSGRMWLSNLDLAHSNFHFAMAYMYKHDGSSNFFDSKILKEALSKVLVPFNPIAGRLARDENGRIEIDCNGAGVLFVEAEADCAMSDFHDFMPYSNYVELVPQVDCFTDISSFPLLLIQLTSFSSGEVCLGIATHHQVVDAYSAKHFINSWAEIARGVPITIPPVHDRSLLRARQPPNPKFDHIEYGPTPKIKPKSKDTLSVGIFKLPFDLDFLKTKVMKNEENNVKYTTFEILAAHICRCTAKSRNLSDDEANLLTIPVNGRHRLNPPLPQGYFGNAIFIGTHVVSTRELVTEPLTKTVERIHKTISQMSNDYLVSAIDYLEEKNYSNQHMEFVKGTVRMNSWVGLPTSYTDFGWGRNTFMQPTFGREGLFILFPSYSDDAYGNLLLFVGLQEEHIKPLETLLYLSE